VQVFFYVKLGMVHAGFLSVEPGFYAISMADTRRKEFVRAPRRPCAG
jgi:hypothetical protein